ncbi:MAG: hypothetical protein ACXVCS_10960, partial [Bdellovibrionota bacterium]
MKAAIHSLTLLGLILSTEAFSSKIQHDSADPSSCSGPLINSDGSVVMADEQKANCLAKEAANKKDAEICKQVASKFY